MGIVSKIAFNLKNLKESQSSEFCHDNVKYIVKLHEYSSEPKFVKPITAFLHKYLERCMRRGIQFSQFRVNVLRDELGTAEWEVVNFNFDYWNDTRYNIIGVFVIEIAKKDHFFFFEMTAPDPDHFKIDRFFYRSADQLFEISDSEEILNDMVNSNELLNEINWAKIKG